MDKEEKFPLPYLGEEKTVYFAAKGVFLSSFKCQSSSVEFYIVQSTPPNTLSHFKESPWSG